MIQRPLNSPATAGVSRALVRAAAGLLGLSLLSCLSQAWAASGPNYPVTSQQKTTAQKVAEAGVPLSELAPNAPDSYTVKRGDTLWDISKLFLKSPWRWPELWGMNLDQIRNPHLIYPGQILFLDKSNGRARLRVGEAVDSMGSDGKLHPRIREGNLTDAINAINVRRLEPFFNEAVILDKPDALDRAPRIVATQEGRVLLSRGETAYVRGELGGQREFRLFRQPKALKDPQTGEVLGYEGQYVGTVGLMREGIEPGEGSAAQPMPSTFQLISVRQEASTGDRLAPVPPREFMNLAPHAPSSDVAGQIVSIYGEAISAGQNQIVALNRGSRDGLERGHVLALWRAGANVRDFSQEPPGQVKLPDERHGLLFVFRVFDRMSYALILNVQDPVQPGDRFTQP